MVTRTETHGQELPRLPSVMASTLDLQQLLVTANGRSYRLPEGEPVNVCAPDLLFQSVSGGRRMACPG